MFAVRRAAVIRSGKSGRGSTGQREEDSNESGWWIKVEKPAA